MKAYLILGCWGRTQSDIKICSGLENEILDITKPSKINLAIIEYLDNVYNILKHPIYKNVHTAIFNIKNNFEEINNPIFDKKKIEAIEEFCVIHRKCGPFLKVRIEKE